jgi:lipopolysaccharide biosynthesis protein
MTLPLENLYNHKDIDIKYCLCWANENWTRTWDGQHEGILLAQKYLENDPHQFIADVAKYFKDERYIRIDNKPVLIVYNTIEIKDFDRYINVWRTEAIKLGFEGIYIISTNACNYAEKKHEIDAMVEFPPHEYLQNIHINSTLSMINKKYSGWIYDYNNYCTQAVKKKYATKTLQSVMLGWDGTARRQHTSVIFHNFSITKFKQLISQRLYATHTNNDLSTSEKFVFINAWNEWAEGTHLEPDRKNGFAYLNAVYEEIKHFDKKYIDYLSMDKFKKHNDTAIIFHLYYLETLDDFIKKSARFHAYADFYFCIVASVFSEDLVKKIKAKIPYANIIICENRGRDILSFIRLFKKIEILNYKYVCKLHSKRSVHMDESAASRWFNDLMEQLLNCDFESVKAAIDQGSGLLIPNG